MSERDLDLTPVELECMRCGQRAPMRFAGVCSECRDALRAKYAGAGRVAENPVYEPKTNVTPNAVALRDD